jgi:hypothetical protein
VDAASPPSGLVGHRFPAHLFHVPIAGSGLTIAGLFELFRAEGPDRVGLHAYDWEWFTPLREGVAYRCEGGVDSVEHLTGERGAYDEVVFHIDLHDGDALTARATTTWHLWRRSEATT